MFLESVGIILKKSNASHYKMVMLDKMQGKIDCVTTEPTLSVGSLITYNSVQKRSIHFISDSNLLYIPLSLAQADMLFFHHVLELIYYFTHVGSVAHEVFDLLAFLYSTDHALMTLQSKKFFLLKLLTSMGSVPELNEARSERITQLNGHNIKRLHETTITRAQEKELDRWLWCCVWQHPYVNEFKTVHFLVENRTQ